MAGPTVTLTFAGDTRQLEGSMDRVGGSAEDMRDRVGSASRDIGDSGRDFGRYSDAADRAEQRTMGFRDMITGTSDVVKGFRDGDILTMAAGFGDLASGMSNLVIPAIGGLSTALRTGLGGAMSFIAAHPFMIAMAVLVGIFVLLWTHSETFREMVTKAFNWVVDKIQPVIQWVKDLAGTIWDMASKAWEWISGFFGKAFDWVQDKIAGFIRRFVEIRDRVLGVFTAIKDGIKNAFKAAFNWVADIWNRGIGRLSISIPDWVPIVGGKSFSAPQIPKFHTGGVVPGLPGQEVLTLLQAGERVTAARSTRSGGGGFTVSFSGSTDQAFAQAFMKMVRTGQIQIVGA